MKRFLLIILCAALLAAAVPLAYAAFASEAEFDADMPDEIIIRFFDKSNFPDKRKQYDDEVAKVLKDGLSVVAENVYVVKEVDFKKNPNAVLNKYKNSKFIEYVEPNYRGEFDLIPDDPGYYTLSAILDILNAPSGWDIVTGGGPIVAVVDSGVYRHPDLPALLPGYSAVAGLSPNADKVGHGTGVAGTIGALGNNGTGTVGINWDARLLPVKVDDADGNLNVANIAKGIIWAADNGADIINLSLSVKSDSVTLKFAVDYAYSKGCAIFTSVGNNGSSGINYPARYANVMAVGATPSGTSRAAASNYGDGIGVVAISGYYTTTNAGGYAGMTGTSFSCPQVSGLASLVLALNPGLTNDQVYSFIEQGAKPINGGYNVETGHGVIDVGRTLALVRDGVSLPVKDLTPPELTLLGSAVMEIIQGEEYIEPGFTATDGGGSDIAIGVIVAGVVEVGIPGLYRLYYSVVDASGNIGAATRVVEVIPAAAAPTEAAAPVITIIGPNPVILHLYSGTPYTEYGAYAVYEDGGGISENVNVSGTVDRNRAGTYSITYALASDDGIGITATREVRVLAPIEKKALRKTYSAGGSGTAVSTYVHRNVVAESAGNMDFYVTGLDGGTNITVVVRDQKTGASVYGGTYAEMGAARFWVDAGSYDVYVTINAGNGNSRYGVKLVTPESVYYKYEYDEAP